MLQSLFTIWICHFLMDLIIGIWPIYKILAGLDLAKASLIAGVCMIVGEAFQMIFGMASSQTRTKPFMILGMLLVGSVGFLAYSQNYLILFLIILLISIGSSAFHPAAAGTIGSWDHKAKSFLITCFYVGGTVGAGISQFAFAAYWMLFQGETIYLFLPVIGILIWLVLHRFPQGEKFKPFKLKELINEFSPYRAALSNLFWIQVIVQVMVVNFMFLLPDLMQTYGYPSWLVFGGGDFFFVIGAAVFGLLAGYFSDLYPYRNILLFALLASFFIGDLLLFLMPLPVSFTAILLFLLGGFLGLTTPMILAAGMNKVPPHMKSLVGGLLMGGATCLAGISLSMTGGISQFFGQDPLVKSLLFLSILILAGFFLTLNLEKNRNEERACQFS